MPARWNLEYATNILSLYGKEGADWLQLLPSKIADCQARWQIQVEHFFPRMSFNYVASVKHDNGSKAVLKIVFPSANMRAEWECLKAFEGQGCVQMIDADLDQGYMLLECVEPGNTLSSEANDEIATSVIVRLIQKIASPVSNSSVFSNTQHWLSDFEKLQTAIQGQTPFTRNLVDSAAKVAKELVDSMGQPMLLHGDLHHDNILSSSRDGWLAIDPKGFIAEREFEVGAMLRNPIPKIATEMNTKAILAARLSQLSSELGFDKQRMLAWGFSQAVLAAWWSYEDTGKVCEPFLICAHVLQKML